MRRWKLLLVAALVLFIALAVALNPSSPKATLSDGSVLEVVAVTFGTTIFFRRHHAGAAGCVALLPIVGASSSLLHNQPRRPVRRRIVPSSGFAVSIRAPGLSVLWAAGIGAFWISMGARFRWRIGFDPAPPITRSLGSWLKLTRVGSPPLNCRAVSRKKPFP